MQTPRGTIDDSIMALLQEEEILAKMSEAKSAEECYDIVKDKVTVSFEEFAEMMAIGKSYMEEAQEGLLSEEDLDAVAGGKNSEMIVGCTIGPAVVVVAVAAGAAAAA